jgi:AcrR family transcriptional regulator
MAPEARREMIVDAALPLILEHGERVTTRQIADAAGIAEGTIFRAFADKDEVVAAVVARALDSAPLDEALAAIDVDQPLERSVEAAVAVIQLRVIDVWRLLSSVGPRFHDHHPSPRPPLPALVRLFEAHRDELGVKPAEAARRLRAVTLATTHPALNDAPMSPRDVVRQFLYGVHARRASC